MERCVWLTTIFVLWRVAGVFAAKTQRQPLSEQCCDLVDERRQKQSTDNLGSDCLSSKASSEVRQKALWALERIGLSAAYCAEMVAKRLADGDDHMVRLLAARALVAFGRTSAEPYVNLVRQHLIDEDENVQKNARKTLKRLNFTEYPVCSIMNSNLEPGLNCACRDGYEGVIWWQGDKPMGECVPSLTNSGITVCDFFTLSFLVQFIPYCLIGLFIGEMIRQYQIYKLRGGSKVKATANKPMAPSDPDCVEQTNDKLEPILEEEKRVSPSTQLRKREGNSRALQAQQLGKSSVADAVQTRGTIVEHIGNGRGAKRPNLKKNTSADKSKLGGCTRINRDDRTSLAQVLEPLVAVSSDDTLDEATKRSAAVRDNECQTEETSLQRSREAHHAESQTEPAAVEAEQGLLWLSKLATKSLSHTHLVALESALGNVQQKVALERARREITSEDNSSCVVCFTEKREIVLLDCGHFVVCHKCAYALDLCPICRQPVRERRRIFSG